MRKRYLFIVLAFIIAISCLPGASYAAKEHKVIIVKNGGEIPFKGDIFYHNDKLYLPLAELSKATGVNLVQQDERAFILEYNDTSSDGLVELTMNEVPYIELQSFADKLDLYLKSDWVHNYYYLIMDEASREDKGVTETQDIYGFKVTYTRLRTHFQTDSRFTFSRGPYDVLGNNYTQLTLDINLDEENGDVQKQYTDVEKIMRQKINGKVVDSVMNYLKYKLKPEKEESKEFTDGNYVISVFAAYNYNTYDYSNKSINIFKKPKQIKLIKENVHGFSITYDKNSRYTKNRVTIMDGPFESEEGKDGRLFMIGVGYDEKTSNFSAQCAETGIILKQHLNPKVVAEIIKQVKLVDKNANTGKLGFSTPTKEFKSGSYRVAVSNGPFYGVEIVIYKDNLKS